MAGIGKAKIARAREKHFLVRKKTQFEECASRVCMDVVACKLVVRPEWASPACRSMSLNLGLFDPRAAAAHPYSSP